jgi:hypothetical protein
MVLPGISYLQTSGAYDIRYDIGSGTAWSTTPTISPGIQRNMHLLSWCELCESTAVHTDGCVLERASLM